MGGLLDKAESVSDSSEDSTSEDGTGLLAQAEVVEATTSPASNVISPVESKGADEDGPNWVKMGTMAGVAFLLLFAGYQVAMGFNLGGYSLTFTDVEIDEDDNDIRVKLRVGTPMFGGISGEEVQLSATYNGTEVWSGTESIASTTNWFEIPLSAVYQGNSRDATGFNNDKMYVITATQGGQSTEIEIQPALMDRTLDTSDAEIRAIVTTGDCPDAGSEGTNGVCHMGAQFRIGMGIQDPINSDMMWHVNSDYSVAVSLQYSDTGDSFSEISTLPAIDVDGDKASWGAGAGMSSGGAVIESAWMYYGGDLTDGFSGYPYLSRDSFYQGDGCYRISFTITHDAPFGDSFSGESTGHMFYWEYNEERDTEPTDNDGNGEPDEGSTEPYKSTEEC